LLVEIVAAVRAEIGPNRALGVRICGDELIDGGTTIEEAVEIARIVEATGAVDYINTSIGVATASLFMIEASMHIPPGYAMFIPSAIRKAVDLPVIGVGRFKDPLQAERALAEGHCDLVGVVRGQIADADFVAKGAGRSHRRHPVVPVVQPGVRRSDGAQPLVRLHRESSDRARVAGRRRLVPCGPPDRATFSSSGPVRPACRQRSLLRATGTV
jgi:2,4-dienoyl-CoA reductase-like NADH-dependent reductase (Old Yellow Enzyme family)